MRSSLTSVFTFVVLFAGAHAQRGSSSQEYSPPGRLVDIGGRKLHLYCTGKGSPTVILVAGGGAFSIDWARVQPKIAENTRVCSYDRAGLAWSDPGPDEETVEETVNDLHSLLHVSGERAPYVLVSRGVDRRHFHSGVSTRLFQRRSRPRLHKQCQPSWPRPEEQGWPHLGAFRGGIALSLSPSRFSQAESRAHPRGRTFRSPTLRPPENAFVARFALMAKIRPFQSTPGFSTVMAKGISARVRRDRFRQEAATRITSCRCGSKRSSRT